MSYIHKSLKLKLPFSTMYLFGSAGPGTSTGSGLTGSPQHPSDPNLNNQTGCHPQDDPLTEQQQFVHQMLKALANTNNEVTH